MKLVQLLEDEPDEIQFRTSPAHAGVIHIFDPKALEKKLHKYYRHEHYTSFQRQLNNFGFNKLDKTSGPKNSVYVKVKGNKMSTVNDLLKLKPLAPPRPRRRASKRVVRLSLPKDTTLPVHCLPYPTEPRCLEACDALPRPTSKPRYCMPLAPIEIVFCVPHRVHLAPSAEDEVVVVVSEAARLRIQLLSSAQSYFKDGGICGDDDHSMLDDASSLASSDGFVDDDELMDFVAHGEDLFVDIGFYHPKRNCNTPHFFFPGTHIGG